MAAAALPLEGTAARDGTAEQVDNKSRQAARSQNRGLSEYLEAQTMV